MEHPLQRRAYRALALLLCAAAVAVGCRRVETRFDIVSFLDAGQPARFTERFDHGSFSINALGNYRIAFRLPPALVETARRPRLAESPATLPTEGAPEVPDMQETWMSQILHIETLWLPQPGTTYAEKTQTNATLRYCLIAGDDAISYEGAGFVYFQPSRDGKTLEGRIESSSLFPARWAGAPADLFGSCHLTGTFKATECRRDVADAERSIRRLLGSPRKRDGLETDPSQGPAD